MLKTVKVMVLTSTVALTTACAPGYYDQEATAGALAGGAAGFIGAKALGANSNWTILATLAGATAGTLVAQNSRTNQCAYARGDGTYVTRPC